MKMYMFTKQEGTIFTTPQARTNILEGKKTSQKFFKKLKGYMLPNKIQTQPSIISFVFIMFLSLKIK